MTPLLEIQDLEIAFPGDSSEPRPVVRGVSLTVGRGEIVGLVGESGSGKTLTSLAVLGLLPPPGRVTRGRILLTSPRPSPEGEGDKQDGSSKPLSFRRGVGVRSPEQGCVDLLTLSPRDLRKIRGRRIAMVFQEPATAFNPVYTLGFQIAEAVRAHRKVSRKEALAEAVRLLDRVALADARRRLDDYPHQLSGGQRQRAMIAMALAAGPDLLLADEPTTALDVTLQAQILELLEEIRRDLGLAVLLITHDLGVVAETCDRVVVMRHGQVVEEAGVVDLFRAPAHPYTRELLATLPRLDGSGGPSGSRPA